jgi:glycosyltransferase involved in cell wall biosynthesis
MSSDLRVLLVGEACNPDWTSVPLVGWSHARAIAEVADTHLVTQVRNRTAILRAGLVEGRDFTAVDSEVVAKRIYEVGRLIRGGANNGWTTITALSSLSYYYFEHLVWKEFGPRIKASEFDIVHRLTPLSPTTPSLLAGKCRRAGVPFILGPLNGGVPWPRGFDGDRRREREWLSYVRDAYKLLPGYHATRRNAAAIIIGSKDTWKQMPPRYHPKCVYVPENAVDPARFTRRRTRNAGRPLRAVFVGRLVPYKGADMLLLAAAPLVREGALTIEIIGNGPEMPLLHQIVQREGIAGGVTLAGWVPHEQVQNRLVEADVFAFPSIREFGGAVVLEAMAVGLVPIVMNYGGPAELVTQQTGFRIEMGDRGQIVERLRRTLAQLANDPRRVDRMSAVCEAQVEKRFTWEAKAKSVLQVYRWVLGTAPRPQSVGAMPDMVHEPGDSLAVA